MSLSKRNARRIRAGILAARLPHRLREMWRIKTPHDSLTLKAFDREWRNVSRFRISITFSKEEAA